jgi:dTDP-4-amino-4,6-dideoxygalactose transaminase
MFYQLPPAGERIILRRDRQMKRRPEEVFSPFSVRFYDSGTAALAATLIASIAISKSKTPEVVLPAYGCPDLVSAVLCAGARPRLVDLMPDQPWMDLDQLRSVICDSTVAVVAVDLFGIPERHSEIKALLHGSGIPLVQDSAQALPRPEDGQWQGDYVVLSFGRGKPVSLLGGGAVLFSDPFMGAALQGSSMCLPTTSVEVFRFRLKALAYNALISPYFYWLPARLPFLKLGETRYEPLDLVGPANPILCDFLPENINAYWRRPDAVQVSLTALFADVGKGQLLDLLTSCYTTGRTPRLLRYPVLAADSTLRDRLFHALDREGLGVSKMYPVTLPYIQGLDNHLRVAGEAYPNAEAFARRILTFPIHSQVREHDLQSMRACISAVIGH